MDLDLEVVRRFFFFKDQGEYLNRLIDSPGEIPSNLVFTWERFVNWLLVQNEN